MRMIVLGALAEDVFSALLDRLDEEGKDLLVLYSWMVFPALSPEEEGEVISHALRSLSRPDK